MNAREIKTAMLALAVWIAAGLAAARASSEPAGEETTGGLAAAPATALRNALAEIEPGKYVRLEVGAGERLEGYYLEARNDSLCIAQDEWEVATALRDVRALWTRERATRTGAIAGGITGGVLGAAFGALAYALGTSLCDTGDCSDYESGENVIWGLGGGLVGGLAGGLAGGVVGAAIPRWVVRYRTAEELTRGPEVSIDERVADAGGSAGVEHKRQFPGSSRPEHRRGGYGLGVGSMSGASDCTRNAAPYVRLMLHVNLSPRWTLVPEAGFTWGGIAQTATGVCATEPVVFCQYSMSTRVWHVGLAPRYSPFAGATRPYLTAGAGAYAWNESFLGYSAGVGTLLAAESRHPIELELRYHANLQRLVEECPSRLISLTASVQVATW
jgi:hypothetical protein